MDFKRILFGAIIVIVLYIFYTSVFADKSKNDLVTMHNGKQSHSIPSEKLSVSKSVDYTYAFWIYINDYNYRYSDKKVVLKRSKKIGDKEKVFPEISLGKNQNNIHFKVSMEEGGNYTHSDIVVNTIPLQKWNHVIMTKSGSSVDIYLDGKLVKTHILPKQVAAVEDTNILITPNESGESTGEHGFAGYLSKVNYYPNAINTREAYQLYKEGYGSGMLGDFFNRFKLKFAFLQDNQEKSSIIL
jgi:hypothetical protein